MNKNLEKLQSIVYKHYTEHLVRLEFLEKDIKISESMKDKQLTQILIKIKEALELQVVQAKALRAYYNQILSQK